jgi:invasion protein IalB
MTHPFQPKAMKNTAFSSRLTLLAASLCLGLVASVGASAQQGILNAPPPPPPRPAAQPQQQPAQQQQQQRPAQQQNRPAAAPRPAPPAQAGAPDEQPPGVASWGEECPPQQPCRIFRRVLRSDGNGQLAVLSIGRDTRDQRRLTAGILLPLGIAVRESVPVLVDERYLASLPIETCLPAGCTLSMAVSAPLLDVLRSGTALKFLILSVDGSTVPIVMPIEGMADALRRITG